MNGTTFWIAFQRTGERVCLNLWAGRSTKIRRTREERLMKLRLAFFAVAIPAVACGQSVTSCPMHDPSDKSAEQHAAAVISRGDHAMGFSHERSAHHFRILPSGGAIEVDANDAVDMVTRDEIRSHLKHIAEMFASG